MSSSSEILSHTPEDDEDDDSPVLLMSFNAADPTGAGGLAADLVASSSCGGFVLPITTGILVRDSTTLFDYVEIDSDAVEEQARSVLQDMEVDVIKVGFGGSPESLAVVAEITADYEEIPVITQATPISWWESDKIESYLDALTELILPQTSVLVGNYDTLWRWLLPDWSSDKRPSPRDIAAGAAEHGVPYVVITSANTTLETTDTVVAAPEAVLATITLDRYEANFMGAGDTFSAALATLLATGDELVDAVREASIYVNRSLMAGFAPGMGAAMPDRMFWAQVAEDDEQERVESADEDLLGTPPNATRH
ncbi:MAG: hydroxymethylpyrimidine/phosphomethylpyrimidine kinase [Brachymonas sp.]|nr:hydroxymethylpyrimidine/phosphomethylpyrimidine kinase [Brachymonas sp.]NJS35434.1 hydroxymethylpyrimidine/phosphomethylpyrimidine kinase [Brachymonas sp.]